jgi:VWFA-related protein
VDDTLLQSNGTLVRNLRVEDFVVFEDGVPQKIQAFQFVEFTGAHGPEEDLTMTIGPRDGRQDELAREDVRLFVVFWDEYHIRPNIQENFLRGELTKFLRTMLNATDLVAIMDPWTPMSHLVFSRDRYWLAEQVRTLRGRQGILTPRNGAEENHFRMFQSVPYVREQVALTALKSAIAYLGTLRDARKTLLYISQEFGLGRDTTTWSTELIRAANAENVAIYVINPRGLDTYRSNFRGGLLASIAHESGGESYVSNSPAVAIQRAVAQAGGSYVLGYSPTPLRQDGKFHKIEVKVKGDGYQVRARSGYVAPDATQKAAARAAAKEGELPTPIAAAFAELVRVARSSPEDNSYAAKTVFSPEELSPTLSVRPPVVWLVRTPADLKATQSETPPPAYTGREFSAKDRIIMRIAVDGDAAPTASISIGLVSRRGKRLTDLPFTSTNGGWLLDLPLSSIARGEYLIAIDATAGDHRASAYVPIRVESR